MDYRGSCSGVLGKCAAKSKLAYDSKMGPVMRHNLKMQLHMWHMRYLIYQFALVRALKAAHEESRDYAVAMTELVARTAKDLD